MDEGRKAIFKIPDFLDISKGRRSVLWPFLEAFGPIRRQSQD
jgi:hypothetical protein